LASRNFCTNRFINRYFELWDDQKFHPRSCLREGAAGFLRQGFADASLHELEVATGVNKSGLYSEFEDKEDLFAQSIRYVCAEHSVLP
jgi:TetR/AcrR family transcriptional regulator, copper-responsive repressor